MEAYSGETDTVSGEDWVKGISLSVLASIIGGASKLAIRKSWLLQSDHHRRRRDAAAHRGNDVVTPRGSHSRESHLSSLLLLSPEERRELLSSSNGADSDDAADEVRNGGVPPRQQPPSLRDYSLLDSVSSADEVAVLFDYDPTRRRSHTACSRPWYPILLRTGGMIGMTFLNPLCCVLAMNYASPSILAPFSGLTLVWVILLSSPVVGEKPSKIQVVAATLIILGEVVIGVFGDHTNDDGVSVRDVVESYQYKPFQAFCCLLLVWLMLLARWMRQRSSPTLRRFAWGVSGGSITGLQNFLKDALTIVKAVKGSTTDGTSTVPWFLLGVMIFMAAGTAFGGLVLLTLCMKRYDATYSASCFVGSFIISASIMSAVHYKTFHNLEDKEQLVLYPTGLAVLMGGVYMLVLKSKEGGIIVEPAQGRDSDEILVVRGVCVPLLRAI